MGDESERGRFLEQVRKACRIGKKLRDLKIRHARIIRIDSAASPGDWARDPEGNTRRIAQTFREPCSVAEGFGERLAAEGEICWGGMHSWRHVHQLLESTGHRPWAFRRTWPTPCSSRSDITHRKTGCFRRISIGRIASASPALIERWPRRCVPGPSIFTWRKMMAP